ncbi:MAG: phosphate ABC transporter substrate-binding protein [Bdellovibrionales bacterium]|nr:phosphate ABC transporter substrate-binding protein [Bdellovibrionales bacterium]MBT3526585.1 phosphate ABC transporter substrate-binding protein [Bdellovibrionales bacterium]MBT7670318.1 phosphate ABC transporter substrate-binding protein [Bdellovibrionales bacterium]MBT7768226.1 phosphate ABC transporter substrate-binding protein [Bdellovibrionales bacterium]
MQKLSINSWKSIIIICLSMVVYNVTWGKAQITYIGSSTVGKFMHDAVKIYDKVSFKIDTNPESGGGETATAFGKCDLGGVARDVKPKILNKGVKKFLIGRDAIGVWVNKSNPVSELSMEQLRKIFSGLITNWAEVGGNNQKITVYIVNPQSATRKVFSKAIMGKGNYAGNIQTTSPDPKVIDRVAANSAGIGQLSFALGNSHPQASSVKKINIDGKLASVNNPEYQITRPLYLITKGAPQGKVKAFIDWSISEAGQKIVKKNFVGR